MNDKKQVYNDYKYIEECIINAKKQFEAALTLMDSILKINDCRYLSSKFSSIIGHLNYDEQLLKYNILPYLK